MNPAPLEALAELLDMEPDDVRKAARNLKKERECTHDWQLTWPNDPEEWVCKLCGRTGTR